MRWSQCDGNDAMVTMQSARCNPHDAIRTMQSAQCNPHNAIRMTMQFAQRCNPQKDVINTMQSAQFNPHDKAMPPNVICRIITPIRTIQSYNAIPQNSSTMQFHNGNPRNLISRRNPHDNTIRTRMQSAQQYKAYDDAILTIRQSHKRRRMMEQDEMQRIKSAQFKLRSAICIIRSCNRMRTPIIKATIDPSSSCH